MRVTLIAVVALFSSLVSGAQTQESRVEIPIGGNAWVEGRAKVTEAGLVNWTDRETVCRTFFKVSQGGTLNVSLLFDPADGPGAVSVTIAGSMVEVEINGKSTEYFAGGWNVVGPMYISAEIRGVKRSGNTFGTLKAIAVSGTSITPETAFVRNNEGNYFYWGRRGPSVHLRYKTEGIENIEWFYNEVTVPEGNDVIGSYFMANGFKDGYFGIQVNSETERRVLFSVWSPYKTDDPKSIPEEYRIKMIAKGNKTYTGEFGNEGAGGQSYLKYMWKTGATYRFLLRARPVKESYTEYTAWFFLPEETKWILIASFSRPKTTTYLSSLYSFLENFIPETGIEERMAFYGNAWVRTTDGKWSALTQASLTGDNTARKGYRLDYAGGVKGNRFYLMNCGFFDGQVKLDQTFSIRPAPEPPKIDFDSLDKEP